MNAKQEYRLTSAQRENAGPQEKVPVWPIIEKQARPIKRTIRAPKQILFDKPKPLKTEGASARNNNNGGRLPFFLTSRFSCRRAPVRALVKRSSICSDSGTCMEDGCAETHRRHSNPSKGRRIPWLQHTFGRKERQMRTSPRNEKRNITPPHQAPLGKIRGSPTYEG
ncbi:unnamed protein product [Lactuca saligna]|uniref:Uncharacterized protein n=1 Tax=Lactuca saligna TaxID=75948 RepID=A0AA35Y3T1_LACSI|nr:unnamed protein product [Lactuca saligna]